MITEIFAAKRPPIAILGDGSSFNLPEREGSRSEDAGFRLVPEELFRKVLAIERKRSERSRQRFVLMLLHVGKVLETEQREMVLEGITEALSNSARETDLHGWYENGSVVGVICTEIGQGDLTLILNALESRVGTALQNSLRLEQMNVLPISFHVFPDDLDVTKGRRTADISISPNLVPNNMPSKTSQLSKRAIDAIWSLVALALLPRFMSSLLSRLS
jgi:hypothetical protein